MAAGRRQEYTVVSNQPETDAALFPQPSSPFHLHPQKETSGQVDSLDLSDSKHPSVTSHPTQESDREHLKQRSVASQKRSYQHPDVKQAKAREDIVERNKTTLGINAHKQGSYLRAHRQRDKIDGMKQVSVFLDVFRL